MIIIMKNIINIFNKNSPSFFTQSLPSIIKYSYIYLKGYSMNRLINCCGYYLEQLLSPVRKNQK